MYARSPSTNGRTYRAAGGRDGSAHQTGREPGGFSASQSRATSSPQSGRFAREWVLENTAGQPSFKAMRRGAAQHQIEEVGERLRAMMPWIKQNALVDKSKN